MSERWGNCKNCNGLGEIPDPMKPVEQDVRLLTKDPKTTEFIFVHSVKGFQGMECGTCNGTGFNGDSQNCPF